MHDTLYYGDRPMYQIWSANVKPEIRRYMAEILPIRRKTLSKQSINQTQKCYGPDTKTCQKYYKFDLEVNVHFRVEIIYLRDTSPHGHTPMCQK